MKKHNLIIGFASLLISTLIATYSFAGCLSFVPFGYNGKYVRLPENAEFCVEAGDGKIHYKTNKYGARIIPGSNSGSKVRYLFGESQLLELDNPGISSFHSLRDFYPTQELHLFAAPNSGPFEALEYLRAFSKDNAISSVTIGFNFSTDIFRILPYWDPKDFVALTTDELKTVLDFPIMYDFTMLVGLLQGKFFATKRPNNETLQKLYFQNKEEIYKRQLAFYWKKLNEIAPSMNIDFIFYPPYWGYEKVGQNYIRNEKIFKRYLDFVCNFSGEMKTEKLKFYISNMPSQIKPDVLFTNDQRHFKSGKLKVLDKKTACQK